MKWQEEKLQIQNIFKTRYCTFLVHQNLWYFENSLPFHLQNRWGYDFPHPLNSCYHHCPKINEHKVIDGSLVDFQCTQRKGDVILTNNSKCKFSHNNHPPPLLTNFPSVTSKNNKIFNFRQFQMKLIDLIAVSEMH